MGRSRGGLTTKIHAMVDAKGRPVKIALTAGQAGDAPAAAEMLPLVTPGSTLIADRAYDTNAIRDACAQKKAWANIPPRVIRKDSFAFSAWVYRQRNLIERFFNRIKQFRGLATRYDRSPDNFLAALKIVAARIWLATI
jgi:transposase